MASLPFLGHMPTLMRVLVALPSNQLRLMNTRKKGGRVSS